MKIKGIGFVAIPVTDVKRARSFYEEVLGLKVSDEMMGGKWIEYSVGDETLAIANVIPNWTPSDQGTGAALEVENFAEAIQRLRIEISVLRPNRSKRRAVTWRSCRTPTATN